MNRIYSRNCKSCTNNIT